MKVAAPAQGGLRGLAAGCSETLEIFRLVQLPILGIASTVDVGAHIPEEFADGVHPDLLQQS